ncbi:hypothetical protein ASG99_28135 [Bacillus sp. Soil768D1]|nr:hypothetical protein ASG99_28135 [Bacillus sp. Soil768D1]
MYIIYGATYRLGKKKKWQGAFRVLMKCDQNKDGGGIMKKSTLIINSILGYIAIGVLVISFIKSIPVYNFTILGIEVDILILILGTSFIFGYIYYLEEQLKIEKKILFIGRTCFFIIILGSFILDVIMQ